MKQKHFEESLLENIFFFVTVQLFSQHRIPMAHIFRFQRKDNVTVSLFTVKLLHFHKGIVLTIYFPCYCHTTYLPNCSTIKNADWGKCWHSLFVLSLAEDLPSRYLRFTFQMSSLNKNFSKDWSTWRLQVESVHLIPIKTDQWTLSKTGIRLMHPRSTVAMLIE